MSRTNFHGPKDVRVIEVRLYIIYFTENMLFNISCANPGKTQKKFVLFILRVKASEVGLYRLLYSQFLDTKH